MSELGREVTRLSTELVELMGRTERLHSLGSPSSSSSYVVAMVRRAAIEIQVAIRSVERQLAEAESRRAREMEAA